MEAFRPVRLGFWERKGRLGRKEQQLHALGLSHSALSRTFLPLELLEKQLPLTPVLLLQADLKSLHSLNTIDFLR